MMKTSVAGVLAAGLAATSVVAPATAVEKVTATNTTEGSSAQEGGMVALIMFAMFGVIAAVGGVGMFLGQLAQGKPTL